MQYGYILAHGLLNTWPYMSHLKAKNFNAISGRKISKEKRIMKVMRIKN